MLLYLKVHIRVNFLPYSQGKKQCKHFVYYSSAYFQYPTVAPVILSNIVLGKNRKLDFSINKDNKKLTPAECLFTVFIIENNLPFTCAGHALFHCSNKSKKYGYARTKIASIINELEYRKKKKLWLPCETLLFLFLLMAVTKAI
ncbi:hypothetical protein PR048_021590 [Dryococelus australis]|uniref:Uncharacterized protein n=1 Tax=Dryococelus australis TaxID=614101 RepID=A0ABQ9GYP9_9NEOP|nr:hypothetical protein PR048_021590 [Dryococelus australis]